MMDTHDDDIVILVRIPRRGLPAQAERYLPALSGRGRGRTLHSLSGLLSTAAAQIEIEVLPDASGIVRKDAVQAKVK